MLFFYCRKLTTVSCLEHLIQGLISISVFLASILRVKYLFRSILVPDIDLASCLNFMCVLQHILLI